MNIEDLSPETIEKAKACKTPEELFALAKEEGIELTEEQIQAIAGGGGDCQDACKHGYKQHSWVGDLFC